MQVGFGKHTFKIIFDEDEYSWKIILGNFESIPQVRVLCKTKKQGMKKSVFHIIS